MEAFRLGRRAAAASLLAVAPIILGSTGLRTNFDERILAAHNRERSAVGVPPLQWNDELAAGAKQWANHLARTGSFEHSPDELGAEPIGENLWGGTPDAYAPDAMVGLWISEKQHFKTGIFPSNSRTGKVDDVGHYTQLIWRKSAEVGCALSRGRSEEVLVCRYSDAGNVMGENPL